MEKNEFLHKAADDIYDLVQNNSRSSDVISAMAVGLQLLSAILKHLDNGIKFDTQSPTNVYGEGLVEGIQNAIVRGQQGITTHGQ